MKTITKGKGWSKRITCKGCNAVLEVEESDIKHRITDSDAASFQYELDIQGTFYVECPECWQVLTIKMKDIPSPIADRIKDK